MGERERREEKDEMKERKVINEEEREREIVRTAKILPKIWERSKFNTLILF